LSLNLIWLGTVALVAIVIGLAFVTHKPAKNSASWWKLLLIWLVIPSLAAWLVSFWVPVIQPKRVLFLLPACYLAVAYILETTRLKWLTWAGLALFLSINLFSTAMYYTHPEFQREDWRDLISQIQAKYPTAQTIAVFAFDEPFAPWRWYADPQIATVATGSVSVTDATTVETAIAKAKAYQYVITFDYLTDLSDPQKLTQKTVESWGYKPDQIYNYPLIGFTRIYNQSQSTVAQAVK